MNQNSLFELPSAEVQDIPIYVPRDYQSECLNSIRSKFREAINRQLIVMATGLGKGSLVAMLPRFFRLGKERLAGKKMLFIVHRKELLDDIANRIALNNPTLKVGIEQEKNWADPDCDIVCASVQTIGINSGNRKQVGEQLDGEGIYSGATSIEAGTAVAPEAFSNKRIERWNPDDFSIVVVDEAHHITGQTYQNILEYFQVLKKNPAANNPRKLLLGFTATPGRADNMGLDGYFQEITYERNIRQAIQMGSLVGISAFTVSTEVSLDDIKVKQGELEVKELSRTVNTPTRNNLVVDKYIEHGKDLPGLGFCVDVQHAEDLALLFRERGISAEAVSYRTPKDDRARIIKAYKNLEIKVLCSATLLSEGFDSASATVAMLARPTKSRILYTQMLGRVLRPFPSPEYAEQLAAQGQTPPFVKESAIVIDIVDVCSRHNLNTVNTLLGIPPKMKMNGEKAMAVAEEVEKIMAKQPGLKLDTISSLKELKAMSERIDLFSTPEIPDAVKKVSTMAWLPQGVGTFVLNIPKSSDPRDPDSLIVRENALGQFDVLRSKNGIRVPVSTEADLKSALSRAEKDVPTNVAGMMSIEAAWRNTTPSDKQITLYASLYPERRRAFASPELFREFVRKSMKKGDLSNLIAARNGRRR
jgi:superfamily II DNA or RNA helicase